MRLTQFYQFIRKYRRDCERIILYNKNVFHSSKYRILFALDDNRFNLLNIEIVQQKDTIYCNYGIIVDDYEEIIRIVLFLLATFSFYYNDKEFKIKDFNSKLKKCIHKKYTYSFNLIESS